MFQSSTSHQHAPPFPVSKGRIDSIALEPLVPEKPPCSRALLTTEEVVLQAELSLGVSRGGWQEGLTVVGRSACAGCSCICWLIQISASCSVFK